MKRIFTFCGLVVFVSLAVLFTPSISYALPVREYLHHVCDAAAPGFAHCDAIQLGRRPGSLTPLASGRPQGLNPADLRLAYDLPSESAGNGQVVAIVDAYDNPKAESDLAVYRAQFGLPPCTTANGCFRKASQTGTTQYPKADAGWAGEIALDLDMVSAICPNCNILLVEARSASYANLGAAVNEAVKLGADVVSNSYGGSEDSHDMRYASYYNHPGVVITASSGDDGYGVEFPAAYNTVVAVGGTSLKPDAKSPRGWSEAVWSGAGSGCSSYVYRPGWQTDTDCSGRTVADVSAVADPDTGVSVYNSYQDSGWGVFGGTSISSPIIAGVYALAGDARSADAPASLYNALDGSLNDITSGSNGKCNGSYLCTARPGYDGPTGLGTPNGIDAF